MLVLALDTALQRCSVAIMRGHERLSVIIEDMERGHAERLAPMVLTSLEEAEVKSEALDRIGVVVGPGGFAGVRIALSFARAFGLAVNVPVVGVNSLAALAGGVSSERMIASLIDARRGQVYAALHDAGREVISPFVASPDEAMAVLIKTVGARNVCVAGSGARLVSLPSGWQLSDAGDQIDPMVVARLAAESALCEHPPAPLYLRPPDAKPPAPKSPS